MDTLEKDWFLQPVIDFEGKSYTLLAWLQKADRALIEKRVFPWRDELDDQMQHLQFLNQHFDKLQGEFRSEITGLRFDPPKIIRKTQEEDLRLSELRKIMNWSLKQIRPRHLKMLALEEELLPELELDAVGIEPLYRSEGYLLLRLPASSIKIYRYSQSAVFHSEKDRHYSVSTSQIGEFHPTLSTSYTSIKKSIMQKEKAHNPAMYIIHTERALPLKETLLPLAEQKLSLYLMK